jgi:hypothetical protein
MRNISSAEQKVENEDAKRNVRTSCAWFMSNPEQMTSGLLYDTHAYLRKLYL